MNMLNDKSLKGNVWRFVNVDERKAELISQRYLLPFVVAKILAAKDIDVDDIAGFLDPKIATQMPNPSLFKDADKLANRLADAIENNEKIGIIGDYDVDGATSTSLMRKFLEYNGVEPLIHIPTRDEGYGPSIKAIDEFLREGATLLITLDCGTTAFEPLEYATNHKADVLVIDHHEAETKLPNVFALVNPKRLDETQEYGFLAAVGVVFLMLVAINRQLRERNFYVKKNISEPPLMQWLDLVALGTVCDVVPLRKLNRAYVKQGLKVVASRNNKGIKALSDIAGLNYLPNAHSLAFVLGPRINACGRVGDVDFGHRLLCCQDDIQALALAEKLNNFNENRKEIEAYVLLQAKEMLEANAQKYPMCFVYGKDWHQGVIGIVAGRLKETYNLPAFVMSVEQDEVKGSARSVEQIDLGALIIAAKEKGLLLHGGGHHMAAGFSLTEEKIPLFYEFVGQYIEAKLKDNKIETTLDVDVVLDVAGANLDLAEKLALLEPFGADNKEPLIMLDNVRIIKPLLVGSGHVRCFLVSDNGAQLKAMAFKCADNDLGMALLNAETKRFDVLGKLKVDTWQGKNSVQFIVEDARIK